MLSNNIIYTQNDIIYVNYYGVFCEQSAARFEKNFRSIVNARNKQTFSILEDISYLEGATPEAFIILNSVNKWLLTQKLICKAYIHEECVYTSIMKHHVPVLNGINTAFFIEKSNALQWINGQSKGFNVLREAL